MRVVTALSRTTSYLSNLLFPSKLDVPPSDHTLPSLPPPPQLVNIYSPKPPPLPPAPLPSQNPYTALSVFSPPHSQFADQFNSSAPPYPHRPPSNLQFDFQPSAPPGAGSQNYSSLPPPSSNFGPPAAHFAGPSAPGHNFGITIPPGQHFHDYVPPSSFSRPPLRRSRSPRGYYGAGGRRSRSRSPPGVQRTVGRMRSRSPRRSRSRDKSPRRVDPKGKIRLTMNEKNNIDCRFFSSKIGCSRGGACHFRHNAANGPASG